MEIVINKELAQKVLDVVDKGLVNGMGVAEPGKMCVEAAVCYALGLPHNDNPPCVGRLVRSFKISLNDCPWSSDKAIYNREAIKSIRGAMLRGEITMAEAREKAQPIIDEMNKRGKELAKEHGMPFKPLKFSNLMR